jgi:hypothetical protein
MGIDHEAGQPLEVAIVDDPGVVGVSRDVGIKFLDLFLEKADALDELSLSGSPVTEGELERALRNCGIETSNAGDRLKAEIKAFYDARKDRRLQEGYIP